MQQIQADLARFQDLGVAVYGISVDTHHSLGQFATKLGVEFPLLSDFNKEAGLAYGVLLPEVGGYKGVDRRSVFVIDQGGAVRWRWLQERPGTLPDIPEVVAAAAVVAG